MLDQIGNVYNQSDGIITTQNALMPPVTFDFLCLIACGTEVIHYFENGLGKPFGGYCFAVIELQG